jgi:hypothetical protein
MLQQNWNLFPRIDPRIKSLCRTCAYELLESENWVLLNKERWGGPAISKKAKKLYSAETEKVYNERELQYPRTRMSPALLMAYLVLGDRFNGRSSSLRVVWVSAQQYKELKSNGSEIYTGSGNGAECFHNTDTWKKFYGVDVGGNIPDPAPLEYIPE